MREDYNRSVFVNCPFDDGYKELLVACKFAITYCDFIPRCALDFDNAATGRIEKIYAIIDNCRLAIHDISRVELNTHNLPRFNMPLELGIFLGARRYGDEENRQKNCIIFDEIPHRYKEFISDISGQDATPHHNSVEKLILGIRNWLSIYYGEVKPKAAIKCYLPGGHLIVTEYANFSLSMEDLCKKNKVSIKDVTYHDWDVAVNRWMFRHKIRHKHRIVW